VYVVELGTQRVLKFDPWGRLVARWGAPDGDPSAFRNPFGIATGPDDSVYVTELGMDRVRRFDAHGRETGRFGKSGSAPGEFLDPRGISVDPRGRVYVVDGLNRRVQRFSRDGDFQRAWDGAPGERLSGPVGIAVDHDTVVIADAAAGRIRTFTPDGAPRSGWSMEHPLAAYPFWPHAVCLTADGRVIAVDPFAGAVYTFSPEGDLLEIWPSKAGEGGESGTAFRTLSRESPPGAPPAPSLSGQSLHTPIALARRPGGVDLLDRGLGQVRRYRL
jgi:DNA-binding beta-propeller fold protein YncE